MKISTFTKFSALNSQPVIQAFCLGARHLGFQVVDHDLDADLAVIWSVLWQGRMRGNAQIYQEFRRHNRPVLILDVGSLQRNHTWKLAVNNINGQGHYGHQQDLDWDRPRKLGITLTTPKINNGKILVCLQHQHSHQLCSVGSLVDWINNTVRLVQQHSDRSLVLRPHPRARYNPRDYRFLYQQNRPVKICHSYDSYDFFPEQYHAVINCNSSPGILAAINGVRPVVDATSLAAPVSVTPCDVEKVYDLDRQSWLVSLCHTEYTLEELQQPLWARRLLPHLNL